MPNVIVVGAQWGDEGKGKIVDVLSESADIIVRFSGGPNAGHTLVVDGEKIVLHHIPSGVLREGKRCALGHGMVLNPETLLREIDVVRGRGSLRNAGELLISERAHLIMPYHLALDAARERGKGAIGTTKRGIGPAYEDKFGRRGLRVGDLLRPTRFRERLGHAVERVNFRLEARGAEPFSADTVAEEMLRYADRLAPYVDDVSRTLSEAMERGQSLLLEGAQGTLLDIDHGTYPFVTSTTTTAGGACAGAGIGPTCIDRVTGVTKAYTTRVGSGPFPTELEDTDAEKLRKAGAEFGATTGRPRRCGWLDIAGLRRARRANGLGGLCLTKLDVLRGLPEVKACVGYRVGAKRHNEMPLDPEELERAEPIYEAFEGFSEDCSEARAWEDLPPKARALCLALADRVGVGIDLVSVGPGREQTIVLRNPFG